MGLDERAFWLRIDAELERSNLSLGQMCTMLGLSYYTLNTQRKRHTLPKIEQLYGMSQIFNKSIEYLLSGKERDSFPPRIQNIAIRCLSASEEDLALIERVLRIEAEKKPEGSEALA